MISIPRSLLALALAGSCAAFVSPTVWARDSAAIELARQLNKAFIEVADEVSPSVVVISVAQKMSDEEEEHPLIERLPEEWRKQFEKWFEERKGQRRRPSDEPRFDGQGSGIIIREDGYIVTNRHVVENAERIRVRLRDGREFKAELRGSDAKSDLAVIKLTGTVKDLPAARFADSDKVRVGEFAIAIGAPFELDYSVTFGHVSAKGRSNVVPTFNQETAAMDQDFLQTDASINPGNSGGPLVNIEGEIIGINTMIRGLNTGIGFAIPANLARQVSDAIIKDGRFARSWLGIRMSDLRGDPVFREMVRDVKDGVVVYSIEGDGPAAKSELRRGDVITAIDGKPVATGQHLKNEIREKTPGTTVHLDVYRRGTGRNLKVDVKTEEWPESDLQVASHKSAPAESAVADLGVTVKTINEETRKEFNLKDADGVVVTEVKPESLADRRGIKTGDVISEVNQEKVTSPKEFKEALRDVNLKEGVMLTVISGRERIARFLPLKERAAE